MTLRGQFAGYVFPYGHVPDMFVVEQGAHTCYYNL